jgi:hypothetical protein
LRWIQNWPGSNDTTGMRFGEFGEVSQHPSRPEAQKELVQQWLALRVWIDERISD